MLNWARASYRRINCTKVCSVPQSFLYTSQMCPPVPPCLTKEEASCAMNELKKVYTSQNRMAVTGCRTACVRHSYRYFDNLYAGTVHVS